jgi:hypothetical protein
MKDAGLLFLLCNIDIVVSIAQIMVVLLFTLAIVYALSLAGRCCLYLFVSYPVCTTDRDTDYSSICPSHIYDGMPTDTRYFTTPHVHADFDIDGVRAFDTSLDLTITVSLKYVTSRDVQSGTRRFELWSPNSSKSPVYPGTKPATFSLLPPLPHRRTDGSGGRYDWTLIPQHLDANYLHHPFILDPAHASANLPEFAYLTSVWEACGLSKGRLDHQFYDALVHRAAYLEKVRLDVIKSIPSDLCHLVNLVSDAPTPADIFQFKSDITWDVCVERVTHIQRLIREKDGWLRMIDAFSFTKWNMGEPANGYNLPIAAAREHCLGAWINGGHKRILHWLLYIGIPCYIIHEYRDGVDFGHGIPERRSRHCTKSFCPPSVWHLSSDVNAYEAIACRNATPWLTNPCLLATGPNITSSPEALARSSSHVHGYIRPNSELFQQPEPDDGDIIWPSTVLFPNCIPWVKPPPIIAAARAGGWSRFSTVSLDVSKNHPLHGREVMQQRGRHYTGDGDVVGPFYDRQHKRKLYFSSLPRVPGLVSDTAYGRPVPFYHFVGPASNDPKALPQSRWMYYSEAPRFPEIGNEAPLPNANDLDVYTPAPVVSNPYDDLSDDDDYDDVGFSHFPAARSVVMPLSPPRSEDMEPLGEPPSQDIETDITSIIVSHSQPPAPCSSSLSSADAPALASFGELCWYVNYASFTHTKCPAEIGSNISHPIQPTLSLVAARSPLYGLPIHNSAPSASFTLSGDSTENIIEERLPLQVQKEGMLAGQAQ